MKQYDLTTPPTGGDSNEPSASEAQLGFLADLIQKLGPQSQAAYQAAIDTGLSKRSASGLISPLAATRSTRCRGTTEPVADRQPSILDWPDVPAGRYALHHYERSAEGPVQVVKFYKVDRPTEGRWAGYTFLSAGAGGPHGDPEWHPIKDPTRKREILHALLEDPEKALRLYGQEIGECGHCGRTLTDEESRAFGVGPVCRRKLGI